VCLVAIRKRLPGVPFLLGAPAITSHLRELLALRGSRYVREPFTPADLVDAVARIREAHRG
jgi:hypothetical protein